MTNSAGAVIAAQRMQAERRMIEALRSAEAFSPDKAIPLAPDRNLAKLALRGLLRQNAVRQAQPGFYYLDEPVYAAIRKSRQRMLIGVGVITVVFGVAIAIATSSKAQTPALHLDRPVAVIGMFGDPDGGAHRLNERIRVRSLSEGRDFLFEIDKRYAVQGE